MMIWGAIVSFITIAGFGYIVWALSVKDDSGTKMLGQIIAVLIFLVAIVGLIMGLMGRGHYGMMGRGSEWMMKENPKTMEMMKEKGMTSPTMKHKVTQ